jgi:hypothetical protein
MDAAAGRKDKQLTALELSIGRCHNKDVMAS